MFLFVFYTELKMTEWKSVKTEDELYIARLPQVYLRRKDCVSIKLGVFISGDSSSEH